jgi:hypothetical protein
MKTPSRKDWGELQPNKLDAECSFRSFYGKTINEAESLFQSNALQYQEDLGSIPSVPFNFYVPAFVKYILSPQAKGDADGASSFLQMVIEVLERLRHLPSQETERLLLKAAHTVATQQSFYEADEDIYGQFSQLYARIKVLTDAA